MRHVDVRDETKKCWFGESCYGTASINQRISSVQEGLHDWNKNFFSFLDKKQKSVNDQL